MNKKNNENISSMLSLLEDKILQNLSSDILLETKSHKKLLSIVIPAYNEEKNVVIISRQLLPILEPLSKFWSFTWQKFEYEYEIVFINDWSKDRTWDSIVNLSKNNSRIKWVNFSRNFGKEVALSAWLEHANWDIIITLDADWQHPIVKIPEFIAKWEEWFDIVYNIRPKTAWVSLFKKISSKLFYFLYNSLSDVKFESWITDYRLLDRKVVKAYLWFKEKNRIYRWIIDYMWFKKTFLEFDALERTEWQTKYNFVKLLKLAVDALTSFSVKPLWLLMIVGWFLMFCWLVWIFLLTFHIFWKDIISFSFPNIVIIVNIFFFWVIMLGLWLIWLYIWNIHEEVKQRPLYIVDELTNINSQKKLNKNSNFDKKFIKEIILSNLEELKNNKTK